MSPGLRDGSHRDVSLETSLLHTQKTPPVLLCEADPEGSWTFILPTDQQGATPLVAIRSLVYRSRNQQTQGSYQQSTNRWVTSRWLRHDDYVHFLQTIYVYGSSVFSELLLDTNKSEWRVFVWSAPKGYWVPFQYSNTTMKTPLWAHKQITVTHWY